MTTKRKQQHQQEEEEVEHKKKKKKKQQHQEEEDKKQQQAEAAEKKKKKKKTRKRQQQQEEEEKKQQQAEEAEKKKKKKKKKTRKRQQQQEEEEKKKKQQEEEVEMNKKKKKQEEEEEEEQQQQQRQEEEKGKKKKQEEVEEGKKKKKEKKKHEEEEEEEEKKKKKQEQEQEEEQRRKKKKKTKLRGDIPEMLCHAVSEDGHGSANRMEEEFSASPIYNLNSKHVVSKANNSLLSSTSHVHSEGNSKRKRRHERVDEAEISKSEKLASFVSAEVKKPFLEESTQKLEGKRQIWASQNNGNKETMNNEEEAAKKRKRVSFGSVTVFGGENENSPKEELEHAMASAKESQPSPGSWFRLGTWRNDRIREDLVWAKRFTKEEDETVKKAVFDYIKSRGWAETEGLTKVLNAYSTKEARGCWKEISNCLPQRPISSVAARAHRLLENVLIGKWSQEDEGSLRSLHAQFGQDWKKIASLLGRNRKDVKDKWRMLKLHRVKGRWTQQELFRLCNMVHENLQLKSITKLMTKPNDHRMLRDDINWQMISDKLGSRAHCVCANEWYRTLASSMVAEGEWANGDDRLFLLRLLESGASEEEAVEWHNLLNHRSGFTCMKRWKQMVKHLGESSHLPFDEKLQILTQRYAPDLLEDHNVDDGGTLDILSS